MSPDRAGILASRWLSGEEIKAKAGRVVFMKTENYAPEN